MLNHRFQSSYQRLEQCMKAMADADGDVYVPNPEPSTQVDYIFICMEPSLGGWAKSKVEAEKKIRDGFRNFLAGYDPMILHYSIRKFLCLPNQRYHLTDFSKGAMLVDLASFARAERYKRWYPLLKEEVDLLAAVNAQVFVIGKRVEEQLETLGFQRRMTRLLHYSPRADRRKNIIGHEEAFEEFQKTVCHEEVVSVARDVIRESMVPDGISNFALSKIEGRKLTRSRLQLMFNYKLAFEAITSIVVGDNRLPVID